MALSGVVTKWILDTYLGLISTPKTRMKLPFKGRRPRAFALVITLALMVLLTLIVVGLLSLSSVALRTSTQGEAMATARANARLALMLALGELQRSAGPDQRITARADILDDKIANPKITGVWESLEIKASAPPSADTYKMAAKDAKFRAWLVSYPDPATSRKAAFAHSAVSSPVTLWGSGSVGAKASARDWVSATKVALVAAGRTAPSGALAWAVLDEGLKARVNTPYIDGATAVAAKTVQLGAGERPGVEFIDGFSGMNRQLFDKDKPEFATIEKGISRLNYGLVGQKLGKVTREALQAVTHDITTQSIGLFTDTAHGGFKQDFHLLTNTTTLPTIYQGKGIYATRLGMSAAAAPSDPPWASILQFSRLYRDKLLKDASGVPYLKAQWPGGWQAATGTAPSLTVNRAPPPGVVLLPTLAKVQMLFSLIGHDLYSYPPPVGSVIPPDAPGLHFPQCDHFRGTPFCYDLHLLYTPIVTLHNPYNVALDCSDLRVQFLNVPFAMQVFRNGLPQSNGLVPLEMMYALNDHGETSKVFGMNLKSKGTDGKPGAAAFRLLPGEVKVFSPYIDPTRSYADEFSGGRQYWDIYVSTHITDNIDSIPGWRGDGIGFDCDWLAGSQAVDGLAANGHWSSCYGLARDDLIHVLFAPLSIPLSNNKFVVQMSSASGGSGGTPAVISAIEINYESPTGLQDFIIGKAGTLRYPKTGTVRGVDMVDHSTTPIRDYVHPKPFAMLSVQAKTTSGARDASNEDGTLATKPWSFAHAVAAVSSQKIPTEHPANQSHEIDLQLLEKGASNLVQVDPQDRGNFISGHTPFNGIKFGGLYDIPLAPLQNFASLNGANPGGASGYLPRFAQPIGNSWAHPLINPAKLTEVNSSGNYLDHSFLLNLAFYDSFYFSGLAAQSGPFGNGKATAALATDFAAGKPLDDPRLQLHLPNNRPAADLAAEVAKADAYTRIAAWQLMQGAFNINSTSVLAWKAMLASIHDSQALVNQLNKSAQPPGSKLVTLGAEKKSEARISRFRLPASVSAAGGGDPRDGYWLGPREYTDHQLQALAESIVKQVRLRGPFLSMAEFVNRQLGTAQTAQCGAMQQAIDDTSLNQGIAVDPAVNAGYEIAAAAVAKYKYANALAGIGPSYQGAPGYLTQADLLNVLGNAATPRSDTFTIRGYGEARDPAGKILAKTTCEAVVQRFPEWVDPADPVETAPDKLTSQPNKNFGRRFVITSLRWLSPNEI